HVLDFNSEPPYTWVNARPTGYARLLGDAFAWSEQAGVTSRSSFAGAGVDASGALALAVHPMRSLRLDPSGQLILNTGDHALGSVAYFDRYHTAGPAR